MYLKLCDMVQGVVGQLLAEAVMVPTPTTKPMNQDTRPSAASEGSPVESSGSH
jgi:hypothetical protein